MCEQYRYTGTMVPVYTCIYIAVRYQYQVPYQVPSAV